MNKKRAPYKELWVGEGWDDIYLVPPAAFKIWHYHYRCEGKVRESWPSMETLCAKLDMNKDTITKWRAWLVDHKWLVKVRDLRTGAGEFSVPVYRCEKGTVSEKISDGRASNRVRKNQVPSVPKKSDTVHAEVFGSEVTPQREHPEVTPVEVTQPKEGREGRKESFGASPLTTPATSAEETETPISLDQPLEAGEEKPKTMYQRFLEEPWVEDRATPRDQYGIYSYRVGTKEDLVSIGWHWFHLTNQAFPQDDFAMEMYATMVYQHGFHQLKDNMTLILKDCPKTAGVRWKDIAYFFKRYGFSLRNAEAWKRKLDAVEETKNDLAFKNAMRKS